ARPTFCRSARECSIMCELLGLCLERPAVAHFTIQEFGRRGTHNADGWGLGWYPDRSLAIIKEPTPWHTSRHSNFLETYSEILASIYVAHVRHRTVGSRLRHADSHPFGREYAGRDYCFAHNGTLVGFREALPLTRFHPVGDTDSEHFFCFLLGQIAKE